MSNIFFFNCKFICLYSKHQNIMNQKYKYFDNLKKIILPDGSTYSTLDFKESGTNNLELYEIFYFTGHRLQKEINY